MYKNILVKNFGAKGDGIQDDTNAIRKALEQGGNAKIIFEHKTYLITQTLAIKSNTIIAGNHAKIITRNTNHHIFRMDYQENIQISNLHFERNERQVLPTLIHASKSYHAFKIQQCTNITLNNVIFKRQISTPIFIEGIKQLRITNCRFEDIGIPFPKTPAHYTYDGIFIGGATNSSNIEIENCFFKHIGMKNDVADFFINDGDGIQILGLSGATINNITIRKCQFNSCSRRGIKVQTGSNVVLKDNTFSYTAVAIGMPMVSPLNNIMINDNVFNDCYHILAPNSNNPVACNQLQFKNNTIQNAYALLTTSGNSFIVNGHFSNNFAKNLKVYFAYGRFENAVFERNHIVDYALLNDASYSMAILVRAGSKDVSMINNVIETKLSNPPYAIYVQNQVERITIKHNTFDLKNKKLTFKSIVYLKEAKNKSYSVEANKF